MKEKLEQILVKALDEVNAADTKDTLEAARVKYLGKKGELTAVLKLMGKLSATAAPSAAVNKAIAKIPNIEEIIEQNEILKEHSYRILNSQCKIS